MIYGRSQPRPVCKSATEVDVVYSKHFFHWRAGFRKAVKQQINRRTRRYVRVALATAPESI